MFLYNNLNKTKFGRFIYKNRYFFFTVVVVFFVFVIPVLMLPALRGYDYTFHIQRIAALSEEINMGNFRPRIYSVTMNNNGYASPLFYGDLFFLFPAMLVGFFNVDVIVSWKVFIITLMILAMVSMYFCTRYITKSDKSAFIGTIMFVLSSYAGTLLFYRGAIGEFQTFVFFPIVFTGFYDILYNKGEKWYLLPLGLAAIIYSHTISSMLTVVVLFLFLILSYKKICEKPTKLGYFLLSAFVFTILVADFVFPMLEQMGSSKFLATSGIVKIITGGTAELAYPVWNIFCDFNQLLVVLNFIKIPSVNGVGYGLIFFLLYILFARKNRNKLVEKLFVVIAIILFIISKYFPWNLTPSVFQTIQFPYRLFLYSAFFIAIAVSVFFADERGKKANIIIFVVVMTSLFAYFTATVISYRIFLDGKDYHDKFSIEYENEIVGGEYLPCSDDFENYSQNEAGKYVKEYKDFLNSNAKTIFTGDNTDTSFVRDNGKLIVEFKNNGEEETYLDVPLLMYKGYTATLEDGTELECTYGKYNRIKVELGDVKEGTVTFEYTGTAIQKASRVVSLLGVVGMAVYFIIIWLKKKKLKI